MGAIHEVHTHWQSGTAFDTVVNGHSIRLDDSTESGGQNSGPRPKALMLSALAGCSGFDVVSILNKMRVEYSDFDIDVTAELSEEHPKVYTRIHMIYFIRLQPEEQPKMEKAVHLSHDKYCGVSAMLKMVCPVTWEIQYL